MSDQGESAHAQRTRAFLDANVLMGAALGGGCAKLWQIDSVEFVTSEYAAKEAWENLDADRDGPAARERLADLLSAIEVIPHDDSTPNLFCAWSLPDSDDVPILTAAIESYCRYLVTSDVACFGGYMKGTPLDGVIILKPGVFLQQLGVSKSAARGSRGK